MVSSIGGTSSIQYQPQVDSNTKLTADQKSALEQILSKYDSKNMTGDSMKSMLDEIKSAGITPSKEAKDTMEAAGFKPPERPKGPPPPKPKISTTDQSTSMLELLKNQGSSEVSQSDIDSLITNLQNEGQTVQGFIVDQKI